MPSTIKQGDIPFAKRAAHIEKWQKTLRASLLNPAIGSTQISAVKKKLAELEKGRTYTGESIEKPGCIDCATHEPYARGYISQIPTSSALNRMKKADLISLAELLGIAVSSEQKKSDIIELIETRR